MPSRKYTLRKGVGRPPYRAHNSSVKGYHAKRYKRTVAKVRRRVKAHVAPKRRRSKRIARRRG